MWTLKLHGQCLKIPTPPVHPTYHNFMCLCFPTNVVLWTTMLSGKCNMDGKSDYSQTQQSTTLYNMVNLSYVLFHSCHLIFALPTSHIIFSKSSFLYNNNNKSFVAAITQMQYASLPLLGFGQNHLYCKCPVNCCLAFWPGPLVHP